MKIVLIAFKEEIPLKLDDGLHGKIQRMTALFNCLDEPFGAVHLFAGIEQRLLVLSAHALLILLIAFEQIGKRR